MNKWQIILVMKSGSVCLLQRQMPSAYHRFSEGSQRPFDPLQFLNGMFDSYYSRHVILHISLLFFFRNYRNFCWVSLNICTRINFWKLLCTHLLCFGRNFHTVFWLVKLCWLSRYSCVHYKFLKNYTTSCCTDRSADSSAESVHRVSRPVRKNSTAVMPMMPVSGINEDKSSFWKLLLSSEKSPVIQCSSLVIQKPKGACRKQVECLSILRPLSL